MNLCPVLLPTRLSVPIGFALRADNMRVYILRSLREASGVNDILTRFGNGFKHYYPDNIYPGRESPTIDLVDKSRRRRPSRSLSQYCSTA